MGWKNWSYWLRGGIVFDLLVIIIFLLLYVLWLIIGGSGIYSLMNLILFPLYWIFQVTRPVTFLEVFVFGSFLPNFQGIIILLTIYFIIGAIIGWIVGKIKKRKVNEKNNS